MKKVLIEVCCSSLDDALQAQKGGADRIELNTALQLGGLTPSLGLLQQCKQELNIPVIAMVRPRSGGFCYTEREVDTMFRDAELLLKNGADGIIFGFLQPDKSVDEVRCKEMVKIIGRKETVFSRAFDLTPCPFTALKQLINLKIKRVLTSGQQPKAIDGMSVLKHLYNSANNKIEILACGGIRAENIKDVLTFSNCTQVHFALGQKHSDATMINANIKFSSLQQEENYFITDCDGVAEIVKIANAISLT